MRFDRYYSFLGFKTFILFLYVEYLQGFYWIYGVYIC